MNGAPDTERMARDLIRTNQEFTTRYPGVAFVFMSAVPYENGERQKLGLASNLETIDDACLFLRMMLENQAIAKINIVPPEGA